MRQSTTSPPPILRKLASAAPWLLAACVIPDVAHSQTSTAAPAGPPKEAFRWHNVNLQGMGWVTGIQVHPDVPNLAYVRTDVGGVFRLDRDRNSWTPLFDGFGWGVTTPSLPSQDVESIAIDPSNPDLVYAALGGGEGGEIFRSPDRGRTWQPLGLQDPSGDPVVMAGNGIGRQTGERLIVDPNRSASLFFGSRFDGIFRSTDAGASWSQVLPPVPGTGPAGVTFVTADPTSAQAGRSQWIYAGIDGVGLYRSQDSGDTWSRIAGVGGDTPYQSAFNQSGDLWVTFTREGDSDASNGGVWRYRKAQNQWTNVTPGAPLGFTGISVDPFNQNHIVAKPARLGFGIPTGIRESFNGGNTWSVRQATFDMPEYYTSETQIGWEWGTGAMLFDPRVQGQMWWLTGYAVFRTLDAAASPVRFDAVMDGLEELVINDVGVHPSGSLLLPAWDMTGFVIQDPFEVPTQTIRPDDFSRGSALEYCLGDPNRLYYSGRLQFASEPKFGRSDDGGRTFSTVGTLPYSFGIGDGDIAISSTDPDRVVWTFPFETFAFPFTSETWYSTNGGASWSQSTGYTGSLLANAGTTGRNLVPDPIDGMRFYAHNCGPDNGYQSTFYESVDGGASFQPTTQGYALPCNNGVSLVPEPGATGVLWVSMPQFDITDEPLRRTTDGARTFTVIDQVDGALTVACGAPAAGRSNPAVYVFGVVNGVEGLFVSDDVSALPGSAASATWRKINPRRLGFQKLSSLAADPLIYGRVLVGTDGRGAFIREPRPKPY